MPSTPTRTLVVQAHDDRTEFRAVAHDWFAADPVRHTMALSVMARFFADPAVVPVLATVCAEGELRAAVLRTPPWPMLVSGLPTELAEPVAALLADVDPALPGVTGPRECAEAFADAWARHTGAGANEVLAGRLYELAELRPPTVPGRMRLATVADLPLLRGWLLEFQREAAGHTRGANLRGQFKTGPLAPVGPAVRSVLNWPRIDAQLRRGLAMGDGLALWELDGTAVSMASANAPAANMSRVVSVYTPPGHRGRGYGSAVTAAVTRWALDAGAKHVLLFTDLANPTSNSIYQKIGYRPVLDTCDLEFR